MARANFWSPETRGLLVRCLRDRGCPEARLVRPVWSWGHARAYDQAAAPRMPACFHTGAFNGRRSARAAPAGVALASHRRRDVPGLGQTPRAGPFPAGSRRYLQEAPNDTIQRRSLRKKQNISEASANRVCVPRTDATPGSGSRSTDGRLPAPPTHKKRKKTTPQNLFSLACEN
jgi:hypothetical protein